MAGLILLLDKAGVNKAVVRVAPEAVHQGSHVIGKKRIVIVEHSKEVRSQCVQACPPGGASGAVVGNDDAADPAESGSEFIDDSIKLRDGMELNQEYGNFLVSLGRQTGQRAGHSFRRARPDANNVFNDRLERFFRLFH